MRSPAQIEAHATLFAAAGGIGILLLAALTIWIGTAVPAASTPAVGALPDGSSSVTIAWHLPQAPAPVVVTPAAKPSGPPLSQRFHLLAILADGAEKKVLVDDVASNRILEIAVGQTQGPLKVLTIGGERIDVEVDGVPGSLQLDQGVTP